MYQFSVFVEKHLNGVFAAVHGSEDKEFIGEMELNADIEDGKIRLYQSDTELQIVENDGTPSLVPQSDGMKRHVRFHIPVLDVGRKYGFGSAIADVEFPMDNPGIRVMPIGLRSNRQLVLSNFSDRAERVADFAKKSNVTSCRYSSLVRVVADDIIDCGCHGVIVRQVYPVLDAAQIEQICSALVSHLYGYGRESVKQDERGYPLDVELGDYNKYLMGVIASNNKIITIGVNDGEVS